MNLDFERVAGPYQGAMGGLAWDGARMLFATVDEGFIRSFDPATRATGEYRKFANRINGLAFAPDGRLLGRLKIPGHCTNMGFGDDDWKSLYVTTFKQVYRTRVKVPGVAVW